MKFYALSIHHVQPSVLTAFNYHTPS